MQSSCFPESSLDFKKQPWLLMLHFPLMRAWPQSFNCSSVQMECRWYLESNFCYCQTDIPAICYRVWQKNVSKVYVIKEGKKDQIFCVQLAEMGQKYFPVDAFWTCGYRKADCNKKQVCHCAELSRCSYMYLVRTKDASE